MLGFNVRFGVGKIIGRLITLQAFVIPTTDFLQKCAHFKMNFNVILGNVQVVTKVIAKSATVKPVAQVVQETRQMDSFSTCNNKVETLSIWYFPKFGN